MPIAISLWSGFKSDNNFLTFNKSSKKDKINKKIEPLVTSARFMGPIRQQKFPPQIYTTHVLCTG